MTTRVGIDSERRPATLSIDEWLSLLEEWRMVRDAVIAGGDRR